MEVSIYNVEGEARGLNTFVTGAPAEPLPELLEARVVAGAEVLVLPKKGSTSNALRMVLLLGIPTVPSDPLRRPFLTIFNRSSTFEVPTTIFVTRLVLLAPLLEDPEGPVLEGV